MRMRIVLGSILLVLLVPLVTLALEGDLELLMPWLESGESDVPTSLVLADSAQSTTSRPDTTDDSNDCLNDPCPPVEDPDGFSGRVGQFSAMSGGQTTIPNEQTIASATTIPGSTTTSTTSSTTSSTTPSTPPEGAQKKGEGSPKKSDKTTTPPKTPPTTNPGANDPDEGGSGPTDVKTDGTISGNACPCTVTGTVALVGNVSLQGDLTVIGGTLVARPGVSVDGNGHQIMFMDGGKADFRGTSTSTWSGNGSNANISRDVNFKNMRRIMFHQGAGKSVLRYFAVTDSGTPTLGDYPVHFHLNGDSTRGTVIQGVAVVNGRNHAFVPHGSHGITFKDVIAKNTTNTAFWWDPPGTNNCNSIRRKNCTTDNSNDIIFDHVLVDGVRPPAGLNGHRTSGFQLGAGTGSVIRNSVANNVTGGKDCAGFHWPENANQNIGGTVWTFTNNRSSSQDCHATFVWQNDDGHHVIDGIVGTGIDHGAYINDYEYRNVDVTYFEVHALGWRGVTGGSIDEVLIREHNLPSLDPIVFKDVQVGSVSVNNSDGNKDNPGVFHFNNTGLTCGDVTFQKVVAGTRIVIDGSDC